MGKRSQRPKPTAHRDRPPPDRLQSAVRRSAEALGTGLIAHGANAGLRERLRTGELTDQEYFTRLTGVTFRVLLLLVADDRGLACPLGDPGALGEVRRWARDARELASHACAPGGDHLWAEFCGLGGWGAESSGGLHTLRLANAWWLRAIAPLVEVASCGRRGGPGLAEIEPGALGGAYERLLGLVPTVDAASGVLTLRGGRGSSRKRSGSYYSPSALVEHLLDSALDPVIDDRLAGADRRPSVDGARSAGAREEAILGVRVCDPAVGGGRFLVGAARRLAHRLASVRVNGRRPSPDEHRRAMRDVIRSCLYGVDISPTAVELCKVTLRLEANDPDGDYSVLDQRIKVGNSLLGATPELMARGIPDEAFRPGPGDRKDVVAYYRSRNRSELRERAALRGGRVARGRAEQSDERRPLGSARVGTSGAGDLERDKLIADAWCAAFVWRKHDTDRPGVLPGCPGEWQAITDRVFQRLSEDPDSVEAWIKREIRRLANEHRFFHWGIEFPEVFGGDGSGLRRRPRVDRVGANT